MSDNGCTPCEAPLIERVWAGYGYPICDPDTARHWCSLWCYRKALEQCRNVRERLLLTMRVLQDADERLVGGLGVMHEAPPDVAGVSRIASLVSELAVQSTRASRSLERYVEYTKQQAAGVPYVDPYKPVNPFDFDEAHPEGESSDHFWRVGR